MDMGFLLALEGNRPSLKWYRNHSWQCKETFDVSWACRMVPPVHASI